MPSSTPKQAHTMAAAAHNPGFAKKVGIPQGAAKDAGAEKLHRAAKVAALKKRAPKAAAEPDGDEGAGA